ncbi:MAG: hypothetical protein OEM58_13195, partial [Nitrospirota bacterium]|nr:hypothetical protein [Nitrospirota bacterium]
GACWTWDSMRSTARAMLDAQGDGKMIPFIIHGKWEDPEVKNIAQFTDVFKDKDNVHAFRVWNSSNEFSRPFSLPPGTPDEPLQILRKAFAATMKDKDYIADAEKSKLTVEYVSGEEVEKFVEEIYAIPERVKEQLSFTVRKKKPS